MKGTPKRSLLRRLLKGVPIPILALVFGLTTGLVAWLIVDRIQNRALTEIFAEVLDDQLHQRAREALIRFDQFRLAYGAVTRLLANHKRMADYLDPVLWEPTDTKRLLRHLDAPPPWLPEMDIWSGVVHPSHVLLVDLQYRIREEYPLRDMALPEAFFDNPEQFLSHDSRRTFSTKFGERPYMIVSESVEDASYNIMGFLVLLVPIDSEFISASQQRVDSSNALVAILDADAQHVLSSTDIIRLPDGSQVAALRKRYVVTSDSIFDYDDSDLRLQFATLVPRGGVEATGQRILDLQRRQRLVGAAVIIAAFVFLFVLLSNRLNWLLKRLSKFSRRALDLNSQPPLSHGNQLLILEDWIREFVALVLRGRDEMRARHASEMWESERLHAAIMETSLDSIITIDQAGRIIEFNPTAERTFSHDRQRALGRQFDTLLLAHESREIFGRRLFLSLESGVDASDPDRFELYANNADGTRFPVEMAIKPMLLRDRVLYSVYIHDISDRKQQEAEIKSLAAIPSESPIPVLRVNRPGVVIYANGPSEPLLRHWGCRRLQTLPVYWKQQVEDVLAENKTRELEIHTDIGEYSLLLAPIRDLEYVNIYARDITREREAQREAQRRQNELVHVARLSTMGEMATGIAHELNQPLSAIVNFANGGLRRLRSGVGGEQQQAHALTQIAAQAKRAGEIIKRMRDMVTRQQPVREVTDLNQLVNEVCALLSHDTRKLEVVIKRHLSGEALLVRVDPVQIEQVMLNLIRNALDVLAELPRRERRLRLSSGRLAPDNVYVAVHDNGPGIQSPVMEHLFDPFFTTKKDGMGMGLAITQTIVAQHSGKIRADSWPGKGTTFTLELPLAVSSAKSLAS